MTDKSRVGRVAAALIALVAWLGLIVQLRASLTLVGSAGGALWGMLRYYTILVNLAVALLFSVIGLAGSRFEAPGLLGGVTVSILLVGIVYGALLRGLIELSGGARLADTLLHYVTPTFVPAFWLAFATKGRLRWDHPLIWMCSLVAYFAYALVRAHFEGLYAYPFMDVARLGWPRTMVNGVVIALGFLAAAFALVWLDRRPSWSGQSTRKG
jgi:hypothetical protein